MSLITDRPFLLQAAADHNLTDTLFTRAGVLATLSASAGQSQSQSLSIYQPSSRFDLPLPSPLLYAFADRLEGRLQELAEQLAAAEQLILPPFERNRPPEQLQTITAAGEAGPSNGAGAWGFASSSSSQAQAMVSVPRRAGAASNPYLSSGYSSSYMPLPRGPNVSVPELLKHVLVAQHALFVSRYSSLFCLYYILSISYTGKSCWRQRCIAARGSGRAAASRAAGFKRWPSAARGVRLRSSGLHFSVWRGGSRCRRVVQLLRPLQDRGRGGGGKGAPRREGAGARRRRAAAKGPAARRSGPTGRSHRCCRLSSAAATAAAAAAAATTATAFVWQLSAPGACCPQPVWPSAARSGSSRAEPIWLPCTRTGGTQLVRHARSRSCCWHH